MQIKLCRKPVIPLTSKVLLRLPSAHQSHPARIQTEVALTMSTAVKIALFAALSLVAGGRAAGQTSYHVVSLSNSGTITGTVKWSGPLPRSLTLAISKDVQVCDPESHKTRDLERLIVGPQGGVANTVVFLKNVYSGKPFNFPESRRFLDQKKCRYEPHLLLVAQDAGLKMNSSDPVLHTIHMDGAATYNLPFPFTNQAVSRTMQSPGLVNVKCNGGQRSSWGIRDRSLARGLGLAAVGSLN